MCLLNTSCVLTIFACHRGFSGWISALDRCLVWKPLLWQSLMCIKHSKTWRLISLSFSYSPLSLTMLHSSANQPGRMENVWTEFQYQQDLRSHLRLRELHHHASTVGFNFEQLRVLEPEGAISATIEWKDVSPIDLVKLLPVQHRKDSAKTVALWSFSFSVVNNFRHCDCVVQCAVQYHRVRLACYGILTLVTTVYTELTTIYLPLPRVIFNFR